MSTIKDINTTYAIKQYKKVKDAIIIKDDKFKLYKVNKHITSKVENKGKVVDIYI